MSIQYRDSKQQPSEHESPPITTRPLSPVGIGTTLVTKKRS